MKVAFIIEFGVDDDQDDVDVVDVSADGYDSRQDVYTPGMSQQDRCLISADDVDRRHPITYQITQ